MKVCSAFNLRLVKQQLLLQSRSDLRLKLCLLKGNKISLLTHNNQGVDMSFNNQHVMAMCYPDFISAFENKPHSHRKRPTSTHHVGEICREFSYKINTPPIRAT